MAYKRKKFEDSEETIALRQAVEELQRKKPTYEEGEYGILSKAALEDYVNRAPFSYDASNDPLYSQYSDKYTRQGKLAMQDTIGQAASLTGGYANSWSQTAGQQAYQGYMQELTDKIPELQQIAYGQYQDQGNDLLTKYRLYSDLEAQNYSQFQDALADYYKELGIKMDSVADSVARDWERYTYEEGMNYQLENDEYTRVWNEDDRAYNRKWNEDERTYSRGQDTLTNNLAWAKLASSDSEEDAAIPALSYKDRADLLSKLNGYITENADGNSDITHAKAEIERLVLTGQITPKDANSVARQLGINADFRFIDWEYADFVNYFKDILNDDGDIEGTYAEIDDFVKQNIISPEDAAKLKKYLKAQG